ncbi:HD-GYP domain-containing protein [Bacillus luti]|nr:HD family phosphohydrolase [Bacillus cereus]
MNVLPLGQVKKGMILEQSIYRHDSLLALPLGIEIGERELDTLRYFTIDFVKVSHREEKKSVPWYQKWKHQKEEERLTLSIIERACLQCMLWKKDFGYEIYSVIESSVYKYKKSIKYLNQLRKLDGYSFAQALNVSLIIASILTENKKCDEKIGLLIFFALMHNIGRVKNPELFKMEGKYSDEQFEELKQIPFETFSMLQTLGFSSYDVKFALEVNENWNGQGYPNKVKGSEIEEFAQYVTLANLYNALLSYRPYRSIYGPYDVLQIIESERDKKVGSQYIDIFLQRFTPYKIGSKVELNNDKFAIVKRIPGSRKFLPIVQLIDDEKGEYTTLVDLGMERDIRIKRVILAY